MNSLIIGVARTGTPNDFVLNPELRYISLCGSNPEVTFSIDCGQHRFFEVINQLRYDDSDPSASAEAISFFERLTTKFFTDLKYLTSQYEKDSEPLHIRLVVNPLELAQVPFEFTLPPSSNQANGSIPLLANINRLV